MRIASNAKAWSLMATAVASCLGLAACGSSGSTSSEAGQPSAGDGTGSIVIWAHQGQDSENAVVQAAVADFNSSQSKIKATLKLLSGDTYTATVTNTPANKLPDVLEIDGPTLAAHAYNQKLAPLTGLVSDATVDNATPGAVAEGTSGGKLYALPMYDSALGLFGNKKMLDAAGVRYPTSVATAWTAPEFKQVLQKLAAASKGGKALDIDEQYGLSGEWGTYAYAPLLWSAGGNLVKDDKASSVLDSDSSAAALTEFQSWKPFVDPNADGNAFSAGRVALGWGGHWLYPTYSKALGADLLALPLPNMGGGAKTGAGSWTWGIGSGTKNGKAAGAFIDFLLNDKNVTAMTTANGAPPATKSAFAANKTYQSGGGLALWGEQLQHACPASDITATCVAVYRPVTAGYPTITAKFGGALSAIFGGSEVKKELSAAAKAIDQNFADNDNFKEGAHALGGGDGRNVAAHPAPEKGVPRCRPTMAPSRTRQQQAVSPQRRHRARPRRTVESVGGDATPCPAFSWSCLPWPGCSPSSRCPSSPQSSCPSTTSTSARPGPPSSSAPPTTSGSSPIPPTQARSCDPCSTTRCSPPSSSPCRPGWHCCWPYCSTASSAESRSSAPSSSCPSCSPWPSSPSSGDSSSSAATVGCSTQPSTSSRWGPPQHTTGSAQVPPPWPQ
jgi:multiple sugar transport system substrate-binding protein